MAITVTDINDGATIIIDERSIRAIYEMDMYRMIVMANETIYDVSDTYAHLIGNIPTNGGNV